jgi:hypothetical protein
MKFADILKKLGILRFGVEKAVYSNAKERPTSLQQDGVFDSEKDVVNLDASCKSDPCKTTHE